MKLPSREFISRLSSAVLGFWFLAVAVGDLRTGNYNNHGELIRWADQPVKFWALVAFQVLVATVALIAAVFWDGQHRKS